MVTAERDRPAWPIRAWLLAGLGALFALAIHLLVQAGPGSKLTEDATRLAAATFLCVGGTVLAFTLERRRWWWAVAFAMIAGAVVAAVIDLSGSPDSWEGAEGWRFASALIAVAIAAPLFQTARDESRGRGLPPLPYPAVHDHAWTNVVMWCAANAFVGIVWLLAWLLSELFQLIGIDVLEELLGENWFGLMLTGTAFGGGIGLLRENDRIVSTLRRLVTAVLAVLGPVLAVGLGIFLLALPFTGLAPLWEATRSTTPILIICVIGALILANAAIGDSRADEAKLPVIRWCALVLAITMLPLAVIAAVSTGLRIGQHGLTPDRLWAVTFVAIATAYGLAYLVSLVRRRRDWAEAVRPANLRLAIGLCGLALLLSTPLISFHAIATRDQVARLESGRIRPEAFDWAALRFDFGKPGKAAVERLQRSGATAAIRAKAGEALRSENRWKLAGAQRNQDRMIRIEDRIMIVPVKVPLPPELVAALPDWVDCGGAGQRCILRYTVGETTAVFAYWPPACRRCAPNVFVVQRDPAGNWGRADSRDRVREAATGEKMRRAAEAGQIEIRNVTRRQVFIGGEPAEGVFE